MRQVDKALVEKIDGRGCIEKAKFNHEYSSSTDIYYSFTELALISGSARCEMLLPLAS